MGKSFELLGMMGFQIFLAMIVGIGLLNMAPKEQTITELTPVVAEEFIQELFEVTTGRKEGMDTYSITEYLVKHLSSNGEYKVLINYNVDLLTSEQDEEQTAMGKMDYITNILQAIKMMEAHDISVEVENISIIENGKEATIALHTTENGTMALPTNYGEPQRISMIGNSTCTKKLTLSDEHFIQLSEIDCVTDISLLD